MKHLIFFSLAAMFASSSTGEELPLLHEKPFQAVILPADAGNSRHLPKKWKLTGFWTPSADEVKAAEKRISEFVALAADDQSLLPFRRKMRMDIRDHPRPFFGSISEASALGTSLSYVTH